MIKTKLWVALAMAALLPAGIAVAQSSKPENAFLKSIADAAERNDVEELVSSVHPVVIDSFGKEKCSEALTLTPKPGMVVAGRAVRSTMATWKNAQGRTQIFTEGTPFKGAVTAMERGKMTGMGTFDFVKDSAGKFHLFIDCNRKFITAK